MKTTTLLLPLCIALAVAVFAQDPGKKPDPAAPAPKPAAPQDKSKAPERPKDDAMTAKDPAIVAMDKFIETSVPAKRPDSWRTSLTMPPRLTFAKDAQYEWRVKTNKGDMSIRLLADSAPMHVSNLIYLARLGFYDGLKFHRVIPGFMAQGGDPLGTGQGGPGYKFGGEFDSKVSHDKPGRLSMANAGSGTDGSQFFLTFVPVQYLDNKHTIFGEVISGMEVLKALEAAGTEAGTPKEPLLILQSWIVVTPAPKPAAPPEEPKKKDGK